MILSIECDKILDMNITLLHYYLRDLLTIEDNELIEHDTVKFIPL